MSFVETRELRPGYRIARVIRGGWQLAGGHGPVDQATVRDDLLAYFDAGLTTLDCADIYTGVEEMIGEFRQHLLGARGADAAARLKVHTKFVPDLDRLHRIDRAYVRAIVERSLTRLRAERLDLVQFHWWDYTVPGVVEAAHHLRELQREGLIDLIGGTNFDAVHTGALVDGGVPLATMQVQYSLLDHRPAGALSKVCAAHGIGMLCYGTLAGGFIGEIWVGRAEPAGPLANRSLVKYKLIIDEFGGWSLFQTLLETLRQIAVAHGVDIAAVAARFVLDRPGVAAVIVGARNREHLARTKAIGTLALTDADRAAIDAVLAQRAGPHGEVYALERDREGRHGAIMRYDLNN